MSADLDLLTNRPPTPTNLWAPSLRGTIGANGKPYIAGFCDGTSFSANGRDAGAAPEAMLEFGVAANVYEIEHVAFGLVNSEPTVIVILDDIDVAVTRELFKLKDKIELRTGANFNLLVKAAQGRPIAEIVPAYFF